VASTPGTCMQTVHPSSPVWLRRWAATSSTVTGVAASTASLARSRGSTSVPTGWRGWRWAASKEGMVVRFEMARVVATRSASHVVPDVSTTQASPASARRNDDQYGRCEPWWPVPPCPWRSSSSTTTSTAALAVSARSRARRTRSMPMRPGGAGRGSSVV
jgi:hypothetical protein